MINAQRLVNRIETIAKYGMGDNSGVTRLAYTKEYKGALDEVKNWMKQAGMKVRLDAAGNLIGRKEGNDKNAKPVVIGSHIDSVFNAGKYDGIIGVLGGIEVAMHLFEESVETIRPLEVIAFNEEEGSRFGSGVFGSRAMAGTVSMNDLQTKDEDGISRWDAIKAFGGNPEQILKKNPFANKEFEMYLELHIEQGPVLEAQGVSLGIVSGIVGMLVAEINFYGQANHAGSTPMNMRHDALLGACELACAVEKLCKEDNYALLGTVGVMNAYPGGINIVPGRAELTIDIRDLELETIHNTYKCIQQISNELAKKRGLRVEFSTRMEVIPAKCNSETMNIMKSICKENGYNYFEMVSGAGHDAQLMNLLSDIGMIFVRSTGGGHNPDEYSSIEDIEKGTNLLMHTALKYLIPA